MGRGRRIRRGSEPTRTTNLDGIFTLNECADYIAEDKWPTIPDTINDLNVTAGNTVINLSWTAPSSNGLPFTLYSIEYTPNGGSPTVVTTSNTSYQLTGLLNDTEYSVRVGAVVGNRINYNAAVTGTPGVAPPALTINYKYTTSRSNSTGIGYQVNEDGNRLGGATRIKVTVVSSSSGSGESIYPIFGTSNVSLTNPEPGGTLSLTNGAVISWHGYGSLLGGRNVYGELSIAKTSSSADSTVYYATIRLTLLDDSGTIIAASNDIDVAWSRNDGD